MTYHNDLMNKANKMTDNITIFHNSSWHHDACGSIMFDYDGDQENYIQLFAFETVEDMKAENFEERFMVQAVIEGEWVDQTIFFTNDEGEALAHAVKLAKEMQDDLDVKGFEKVSAYLDYVNNFMTISAFAAHYELTEDQASELIIDGRILHSKSTGGKGFEWQGVWIDDRTKSPCGRFELTEEQSIALYGASK